jgi:hypothetical protein
LPALSPADFERHDVPALLATIKSDERIQAAMRAYPSDTDVVTAGLQADALLLPYLFGSHSGQVELAFDLNLLPVCASVGYLKDQYHVHKGTRGRTDLVRLGPRPPIPVRGEIRRRPRRRPHPAAPHFTEGSPDRAEPVRRRPGKDFLEYRRAEHAPLPRRPPQRLQRLAGVSTLS